MAFLLITALLALAHAQGSASVALGGCADGEDKVDGKCQVVFDIYTEELGNWTRINIFGRNQTYWQGPLEQSLLSVVGTQDFAEVPWSSRSTQETMVIRTMRCANPASLNTSWESHAWNQDLGLARWSMYNTSLAGQMCGDYGAALEVYHSKINVSHFLRSSFTVDSYAAARRHTLEDCNSFGVQIPEAIDFVIWLSNPHNSSLSGDENFKVYGIQTLRRLPPVNYACFNRTISTGMGMSNVALSKALSDVINSGRCAINKVMETSPDVSSQSFPTGANILI